VAKVVDAYLDAGRLHYTLATGAIASKEEAVLGFADMVIADAGRRFAS
jgi:hypothetical protein